MEFKKHVRIRKEKFGMVIFETLKEKVFVTNPTGAEIIERLKDKKTPDTIITELASQYGADAAVIADDVNCFINNLVRQEVLAK
ncbi:MAG: PqqD family protein [Elusimicrobia bacterium]|nr:PqqD family protein [Elusimicrobiota bacterium]